MDDDEIFGLFFLPLGYQPRKKRLFADVVYEGNTGALVCVEVKTDNKNNIKVSYSDDILMVEEVNGDAEVQLQKEIKSAKIISLVNGILTIRCEI